MTQNEVSNEELRELLRWLQQDPKNEDLWKSLYHHIKRFVFAVAYRVLNGNEELAKDATQVVFLRLFEYCEFTEFSEPQDFLGYVATVARHAALDLIKGEGRYVTGLDLTLCDFLPGTPTPRQHEMAHNHLHDLLEQLESTERSLVDLLMEGRTLDEIAGRLGISYANAGVRIHRLRERLLNLLKTK
ncbi:MAG TPA: sigma-70 family RNA polymerase sigma factor [Terriglobales bacterium]|nr:sigma-70 family RNA polymerase sigma factor [Terriglobales bacterium]